MIPRTGDRPIQVVYLKKKGTIDHCGRGARAKRAHPLYIHCTQRKKYDTEIMQRNIYARVIFETTSDRGIAATVTSLETPAS
jgi:hypothetical protein